MSRELLINMVRAPLVGLFALCCGHWALMTLQDFDRPNVALPQHVWFMLLIVLTLSVLVGLACKRAIFGALLGCLFGAVFPLIFLHDFTLGYSYWEPRPAAARSLEINGPTLTEGETFSSKNCRGKLLLVDYWATWCAPCRAGLPHVLEAWDRYHSSGLDIVGVSLDHDREHLADFVQMHEIPYPLIFFSEKGQEGFNNPLATANGVAAIPQLDLIEPVSGMILTTVPNGRDLNWTVKAALEALSKTPLEKLDLANNRLATVALTPYIFGITGGIIGALLELFAWRKLVPRRPRLTLVK